MASLRERETSLPEPPQPLIRVKYLPTINLQEYLEKRDRATLGGFSSRVRGGPWMWSPGRTWVWIDK